MHATQCALRPRHETRGVSAGRRTLTDVILRAATRPHADTTAPVQQLEAEHDDYDEAMAALRRQVPDGWDLLHVSRA